MLTSLPPDVRNLNSVAAEANANIVRQDSSLPGLQNLLQPQSMEAAIASLLRARAPIDVRLHYLRYKPHRRCIALLDVTTDGVSALVTATAMTSDSWYRWQQKAQLALAAGHVRHIDDCRLKLELFPFDRHLRHIVKLSREESCNRLLRRILPDIHDFRRHSTEIKLERLAYKPARRLVMSVACDGTLPGNEIRKYVVKFHSQSTFERAADRVRAIGRLNLSDPMTVRCCKRYQAIATPWVAGQNLASLLSADVSAIPSSTLQDVGRKLAELHACHLPVGLNLPIAHAADQVGELRRLADDLSFLYPPLAEDVRRVIRSVIRSIPNGDRNTLIHGDFYAKQVIVDEPSIRFIDFDAVSIGNPWVDAGNFVAKLHWSHVRGQMTSERLQWAIHHFRYGYRERGDWNEPAFRCFLAVGLLKSMPHTFRQAAENWPGLLSQLLKTADKIIAHDAHTKVHQFHAGGAEFDTTESLPNRDISPARLSRVSENPHLITDSVRRAMGNSQTHLESPIAQLQFRDASVVRMKPDRRCLVECHFSSDEALSHGVNHQGTVDDLCVIGKIRFKGLDHATPQLHRRLYQAGLHERSATRVPRFLGTVPALNMWLQEKVCANSVTADARTPLEVHAAVGRALAELHSIDVNVDRHHSIHDEMQILERRLGEVSTRHTEWNRDIGLVLNRCSELAAGLPKTPDCLIHRDFYFDQVLYDGTQITLLDLDLAAMGTPELDAGNYLAHLLEYSVRSPRDRDYCRDAVFAFEEAFVQASSSVTSQSVAAWTMISLARHIWISMQIHERRHTTAELLKLLSKPDVPFPLMHR
ncbi:MAG: aminoglycoside phosphotransferase family protein [Planctomycetaceae bacterium]|nr:aminoglycoside phosphotransferase family protein [Planctomycetaceae bacterium]